MTTGASVPAKGSVIRTTREGGRLGFKTHLAPSTVPSQCDLECGPKVIPWRGLRAGPGDHPGRGAPRV